MERGRFRIREVPGNHCDVCFTAPVMPGFYVKLCVRFHGWEFLCPECVMKVDLALGKRFLEYLWETPGCLFEELRLREDDLSKVFSSRKA